MVSVSLCCEHLLCYVMFSVVVFFFFSSRRRHTRYIGDWSSDVCSSDLRMRGSVPRGQYFRDKNRGRPAYRSNSATASISTTRSEERRVGKSVDLGGRRSIKKKKKKNNNDNNTTK